MEEIKKTNFQVSENIFDDKMEVSNINYELPDGKNIDIGAERYTLPEQFFKLNTNMSIPKLINECLQKCDLDVKKEISSNTVLSGCNTLLKGFNKRAEKELSLFTTPKLKAPLTVPPHPFSPYTNWVGGSILASLGSFQQMWISKSEFDENPEIIHKKCS